MDWHPDPLSHLPFLAMAHAGVLCFRKVLGIYERGANPLEAVIALAQTIPNLTYALNFTIFFSMATSLIGNGIVMVEFLSDLFQDPFGKTNRLVPLGHHFPRIRTHPIGCSYPGAVFYLFDPKDHGPRLRFNSVNGMIPFLWSFKHATFTSSPDHACCAADLPSFAF